ncbi:hypothetical protein COLO4_33487 [Corchorus olitorius]|uniref:Uncharacterized protein n=1 Tax=Corchorus olitorius TaxID=93759 RepID=A0A1R3GT49_9ROSI|nr:hypothetical protein COLO4_33487 [Corchorus olitorius]
MLISMVYSGLQLRVQGRERDRGQGREIVLGQRECKNLKVLVYVYVYSGGGFCMEGSRSCKMAPL